MRSILLVAIVAALLPACGAQSSRVGLPHASFRAQTIRVQIRERGATVVRDVPLEEYVTAAVLSEVDPSIADASVLERMFEVQSIISRTYATAMRGRHAAEGFDLCSGTHCQLYDPARVRTSRWSGLAREAVTHTDGRLLWFANAPVRAVFHADCGGHTSSAFSVWNGASPAYLTGVRDAGPASAAHVEWTFETRNADLRDALNTDARTKVGRRLDHVEISARDAAGRAERITLHGTHTLAVRGEVFREVVTRAFGFRTLRSTLFTIQRSGERLVFTGRGFGHGVGLCQAGAFARLKSGNSPENVLTFYFPGTKIVRTSR